MGNSSAFQISITQEKADEVFDALVNCGEFFFAANKAPNLLRLINSEDMSPQLMNF
jgi:hypothetical protein